MSGSGYPKFRNDRAVVEIRIGVQEFNCIGVSPPLDHPRVYINMGEQDAILCPYCATRFRFDPRLGPSEANPPGRRLETRFTLAIATARRSSATRYGCIFGSRATKLN